MGIGRFLGNPILLATDLVQLEKLCMLCKMLKITMHHDSHDALKRIIFINGPMAGISK